MGRGKRQKRKKAFTSEDEGEDDEEERLKRPRIQDENDCDDEDSDETQFDVSALEWCKSSTAQPRNKNPFRVPSPILKNSNNPNDRLERDSFPFACSTQSKKKLDRLGQVRANTSATLREATHQQHRANSPVTSRAATYQQHRANIPVTSKAATDQ